MSEPLKSYHFNCGNSSLGTIGFCARVIAESEEEAVEILRHTLGELEEYAVVKDDPEKYTKGVEYLNVYFGAANLSTGDIDSADELQTD